MSKWIVEVHITVEVEARGSREAAEAAMKKARGRSRPIRVSADVMRKPEVKNA